VIPDTVLFYRRHGDAFNEQNTPRVFSRNHYGSWMRLLSASLQRRRALAQQNPTRGDAADTKQPEIDITVVLVVKNGRRFLPRALASIRKQTSPVRRILAVVAKSRDGSRDYLAGEQDVEVIDQTGTGLAQARNQAISNVYSGLIAFLDCDDEWHETKLDLQLRALALFDQPAMCITSYRRRIEDPIDGRSGDRDTAGYRLGVTPSTLLADRQVFDQVGTFDPQLGSGCDTDWFARALRMNIACAVVGQTLVSKAIHGDNLSRDAARNRANMFRLIAKHRSLRN
jgi:glycosyltransferase involved in cell wall biosynthesis